MTSSTMACGSLVARQRPLQRGQAGYAIRSLKINARFARFAPFCHFCSIRLARARNALRPLCTKPTRRTFVLQDHRVRAAVCQALNNVAFAPSARSRGSAGPIRAKPLHCQFDLHVRRRRIGSYEVFFVLCHLVPDTLNVRRASRAGKLGFTESERRTRKLNGKFRRN
jgi:hypothetical protein